MELSQEVDAILSNQISLALIDQTLELEARFGLNLRQFGSNKNKLSRTKFLHILSILLKQARVGNLKHDSTKPFTDTLDIWAWIGKRRNPIRHTIEGSRSIRDYCKKNTLEYQNPLYLYKDVYQWTKQEKEDLQKKGFLKDSKFSLAVNDSDYGVRFGLKREIPITYDPDTKDLYIALGVSIDERTTRKINRELDNYKSISFDQAPKSFRYKRRYSFTTNDNMIRIDVTAVKSSKSKNGKTITSTSFLKGRILQQPEDYEIELEYVGGPTKELSEIKDKLTTNTRQILSIIQNSSIPLTITKQKDVLESYKNLIVSNRENRINAKLDALKSIDYAPDDPILSTMIPEEISKLEKLVLNVGKAPLQRYYIGPKPFTLEMENLRELKFTPSEKIKQDFEKMPSLMDTLPKLKTMDVKSVKAPLIKDPVVKTAVSIQQSYSVTDKADGERTLLYINGEGRSFLIISDMEVRSINLPLLHDYANSVIDGEFVGFGKGDTPLSLYLAFDVYIIGGTSVQDNPLHVPPTEDQSNTRYTLLGNIIDSINEPTKIRRKPFYFCSNGEDYSAGGYDDVWLPTIEEASEITYSLALQKEYNIDGLIFTPIYLPVGSKGRNTLGYTTSPQNEDYSYNSLSGRWEKALKWKPPKDNSIDFFVVSKKTRDGKTPFISDGYKTLLLYVGVNPNDRNVIKEQFPCNQDSVNRRFVDLYGLGTEKMFFSPKFYNYKDIHMAKVPVDINGLVTSVTGKKLDIRDETVVEFVFDKSEVDSKKRWKVLRLREEKTDDYVREKKKQIGLWDIYNEGMSPFQKTNRELIQNLLILPRGVLLNETQLDILQYLYTHPATTHLLRSVGVSTRETNIGKRHKSIRLYFGKMVRNSSGAVTQYIERFQSLKDFPIHFTYGNYYTTANSVWNSMNNPITNPMLFGKEELPSQDKVEAKYYNPETSRKQSITLAMQHFHNRYVKYNLIKNIAKAFKAGIKLSVLDLCCGKGGDITKWRNALQSRKGSKYVGIDKFSDNIYNKKDGACARLVSYQQKAEKYGKLMPKMDFLVGDAGLPIQNGDAFEYDSKDQKRANFLWNNVLEFEGQKAISPKFTNRQFHIVSCQFAIHYFWSSEELFTQFMLNVTSNLRNGGLFVVTCFDGRTVFDALADTPKGGFLKAQSGGNILWKIKKDYDQKTYPDNEDSFGMPITVYLPSISGTRGTREWLVNSRYMINLLEKAPFHLKLLHKPKDTSLGKRVVLPNVKKDDPEGFNKRGTGLFSRMYEDQLGKTSSYIMSEGEQSLSFMNRYMVFQKKNTNKRPSKKRKTLKSLKLS